MQHLTRILAMTTLLACGSKQEDAAGGSATTGDKPATTSTKKPIDEALAKELSTIQVDGFDAQAFPPKPTGASVQYTSKADPKVSVTVNADKCEMCQKMDPARWKANPNLKSMLSKASKEDPELVWEVEGVDLGGGKQGVYTYVLAYSQSEDGKTRAGANAYNVWFNDGVNQIWMRTGCHGAFADSVKDEASLEATCPRDKQLAAAKQVFAAYAKYF